VPELTPRDALVLIDDGERVGAVQRPPRDVIGEAVATPPALVAVALVVALPFGRNDVGHTFPLSALRAGPRLSTASAPLAARRDRPAERRRTRVTASRPRRWEAARAQLPRPGNDGPAPAAGARNGRPRVRAPSSRRTDTVRTAA